MPWVKKGKRSDFADSETANVFEKFQQVFVAVRCMNPNAGNMYWRLFVMFNRKIYQNELIYSYLWSS